MHTLTLDQWKDAVRAHALGRNQKIQFTLEDGTGKTYGDIGDWTAHTGPDMQDDVVGVYTPTVWWYYDVEFNIQENP